MKSDISIDELIRLAEESQNTPKRKFKDTTVSNFLVSMGIESGNIKVPSYLIFYVYKKIWAGSRKTVSKIQFFRILKHSFSQVRTGRQRYYLLNDTININDKLLIENAKKFDDNYNRKRNHMADYDRKKA